MTPEPTLVHDYLLVMRGAERTFEAMASCWPGAPVSTLLYDEKGTDRAFADRSVSTSYLQRLGIGQRGFRKLLPLFPRAAERLPLADSSLVVSSSSAFAHGVVPPAGATHVSYCHSPFRYAWHERARAMAETPRPLRPLVDRSLDSIREWDRSVAARESTHYIANSAITKRRINEFWERDASIVHPPVDVERFPIGPRGDYFVTVSEIVAHKRVDLALEAARRADQPVKVVGDGPERERLAARYGSSAEFLGRISDRALADVVSHSRGLIVPNVEEFGIAAVEAQAAGRPVVASDAGGTRETVVDGETGVLVPAGDEDAFAEALRHTDFERFSSDRIARHADRFSVRAFRDRLRAEVARLVGAPAGDAAAAAA